ncbi:dihydropteroate synthase [Elusimicrobiota bacterium]
MKISELPNNPSAIMGILNITPDSFYDGGKFIDPDHALKQAEEMAGQGADIIDIGGESTRPGSGEISVEEELARVIPVIKKIKEKLNIKISCDTSKHQVARKALESGAEMVNNVTGFIDPEMRKAASDFDAAVCIMHMKGTPRSMQNSPDYDDVLEEIRNFLYRQAELCEDEGISGDNIIIDPGIGFGKTLEHNVKILANLEYFSGRYPVMIGASRKSFLGMLLGTPVEERLPGSLAVAAHCVEKDVRVIRVHDVKETKETVDLIKTLKEKENERNIAYT